MKLFFARPLLALSVVLIVSAPLFAQTTAATAATIQRIHKEQDLANSMSAEAKREMDLLLAGKTDPAAAAGFTAPKDVAAAMDAMRLAKEESMKALAAARASGDPTLVKALQANVDAQSSSQMNMVRLQSMMEKQKTASAFTSAMIKKQGDQLKAIVTQMH